MDLPFKKYKKNEIIYHIEDIPQAIGIVKEGSVVIETVDFLGNVSLLSHIGPNQMFAESYALTQTPMYVYVRAVEDCDGLGDCLPTCPTGAISFIEKDTLAYDEESVKKNMKQRMKDACTMHTGCPGSMMHTLNPIATPSIDVSSQ